jgi:hypothetical protein
MSGLLAESIGELAIELDGVDIEEVVLGVLVVGLPTGSVVVVLLQPAARSATAETRIAIGVDALSFIC